MLESPKISVLVPIYKVEDYIEQCARSLFEQTIKDRIEYIFVDDCSPDNSVTLLLKVISLFPTLQNNIKIIRHALNKGLAESRNTGIEAATGEYIYIVDSDDWLANRYVLEEMLKVAERDNADIVEANHFLVFDTGKVEYRIERSTNKNRMIKDVIIKNSSITIWNKLIRRNLYTSNDIRVPKNINNGEDYVTLPKLFFYSKKISHLNEFTYNYNQLNQSSFSSNKSNKSNLDSMILANRNLYDFFDNKNPNLIGYVNRMLLETKIYHLLYSKDKNGLNEVRRNLKTIKENQFKNIRWKYKIIYILDKFKLDWLILCIGKKFRNK